MRRWPRWLGQKGAHHQEGGVCQVWDGRLREGLASVVREADRHWNHLRRRTARFGTMGSNGHDSQQLGKSGTATDGLDDCVCGVVLPG